MRTLKHRGIVSLAQRSQLVTGRIDSQSLRGCASVGISPKEGASRALGPPIWLPAPWEGGAAAVQGSSCWGVVSLVEEVS